MTRKIHVNEGFFGRDVAEIDDNGRILMPEGIWGHKVVGYLKDDGIYVDSGIMSQKRVIDIASDGNMYLTSDAGIFSHGTWVGRLDPDGKLYDRDRRNYATITGEKSRSESDTMRRTDTGNKETEGGPGTIGCIGAILIAMVVLSIPAAWSILPSLFSSSSIAGGAKAGIIVTLAGMAITAGASIRNARSLFEGLKNAWMFAWIVGTAIFSFYSCVFEGPVDLIGSILVVAGSAFVCVAWSLLATLVAGIPVYLYRKNSAKK